VNSLSQIKAEIAELKEMIVQSAQSREEE